MKTSTLTLSIVLSSLLLAGCGSSSSSEESTKTDETKNLTSRIVGKVPGTLIEAFCDDGSYYSVNSTDNNTSEHPFELEIPTTTNCRLVMTTNENNISSKVVTPIGIITADGNGTLFQASSELVDLGYIDLAMSRDDINDTNNDGVSDDILHLRLSNNELIYVEKLDDPTDSDNDGLLNLYEDDDNDGLSNHDDDDDDGDGVKDEFDFDHDNDGENDDDNDRDGVLNSKDVDDDNDGVHDDDDDDDDNDGIHDDDDDDDDNDGVHDDDDHDNDNNDDSSDHDNDGSSTDNDEEEDEEEDDDEDDQEKDDDDEEDDDNN